jgi:hypothetical protein
MIVVVPMVLRAGSNSSPVQRCDEVIAFLPQVPDFMRARGAVSGCWAPVPAPKGFFRPAVRET